MRRNAQVKQNAVYFADAQSVQRLAQRVKPRLPERHGLAEARQRPACLGQRLRVLIQPDQPPARHNLFQQGQRMAAAADGAVQKDLSRLRIEQGLDFFPHNGYMIGQCRPDVMRQAMPSSRADSVIISAVRSSLYLSQTALAPDFNAAAGSDNDRRRRRSPILAYSRSLLGNRHAPLPVHVRLGGGKEALKAHGVRVQLPLLVQRRRSSLCRPLRYKQKCSRQNLWSCKSAPPATSGTGAGMMTRPLSSTLWSNSP